MDLEEIAQEISEQIECQTVFSEFAIKEMLNMLHKQKPQYQNFQYLGVGGNGLVLKVDNDKAIKAMMIMNKENLESTEKLEEEFKFMKQFSNCEYILQVYESYYLSKKVKGVDKKQFYIIEMEALDCNLADYLQYFRKNKIEMSTEQAEKITIQGLDSLNFLHQKGICHRDIKPQNFLVKKINGDNYNIILKLSDFGSAKAGRAADKTSMKMTKDNSIRTTESYMAPEVEFQMYFTQSDLFSMGLVVLQIDNPQFNYSAVKNGEITDVQRELNEHPFYNYPQIKRDTTLYEIARSFLKKNPKQRQIAFEAIRKLTNKESNKDILLHSIQKNDLAKLLNMTKNVKISPKLANVILDLKTYSHFEFLGEGAFGVVLGVVNYKKSDQQVAIKIQRINNQQEKVQIEQEIDIMMKFNSPYIIKIHDKKELEVEDQDDKEQYYLIEMERCELSLKRFLQLRKLDNILDNQMKIDICIQLVDALNLMHSQDILHRDIKPDNILINFNQDGTIISKIADFGLSKKIPSNQLHISTKGTPIYLPLETGKNIYGKKTDNYSLGIVLIEIDNYRTFEFTVWKCGQLFDNFKIPFEKESVDIIDRNSILYQIACLILKYEYDEREDLKSCLKLLKPHNLNKLQIYSEQSALVNKKKIIKKSLSKLKDVETFMKEYSTNEDELLYLTIDLSLNNIGSEGVKNLTNSLERCHNITSLNLNLWSNNIGDEGVKNLANSLERCHNITSLNLDLRQNSIGSDIDFLFNELKKNLKMSFQLYQ